MASMKMTVAALALFALGGCATTGGQQGVRDDAMAYAASADVAYQSSDWMVAEHYYREVIARVPNDPYAHFRLGNTLLKLDRWEDAIDAYRMALAVDPTYAKAASNLATVHLILAEQALHIAIDRMMDNDPRAAMLMLREKKIHDVVDIPVDDSRATGKMISSQKE